MFTCLSVLVFRLVGFLICLARVDLINFVFQELSLNQTYCPVRVHGMILFHFLELIELSSINEVSLVEVSSCDNTGSIKDDPYWTSRKNSLELIELSSINKVSLV